MQSSMTLLLRSFFWGRDPAQEVRTSGRTLTVNVRPDVRAFWADFRPPFGTTSGFIVGPWVYRGLAGPFCVLFIDVYGSVHLDGQWANSIRPQSSSSPPFVKTVLVPAVSVVGAGRAIPACRPWCVLWLLGATKKMLAVENSGNI